MTRRLKYVKRPSQAVAAVQLAVDTKGFTYKKWGSVQRCKARDWIVDNDGDVYTVNRVSFRRTYRQVGPGMYVKKTPVWAEVAAAAGRIKTKRASPATNAGTTSSSIRRVAPMDTRSWQRSSSGCTAGLNRPVPAGAPDSQRSAASSLRQGDKFLG